MIPSRLPLSDSTRQRLRDNRLWVRELKRKFSERPGWKVVLRKEARARREVVEVADAFICTSTESTGLRAPDRLPVPASTVNLVGAIELSEEDNLLANAGY